MSQREPLRPLSDFQREVLADAASAYEVALTRDVARFLSERGLGPDAARLFRLRFRCVEPHDHRSHGHGKYMSRADDPARMFNIRAIHAAGDEIHVAEGELDAITLTMIGLHAVAIPGAQAWRGHHARMLAGFSRIWVWGDPDDAGARFTATVCRALPRAKGVRLRYGDVNASFVAGGRDALLSLIAQP